MRGKKRFIKLTNEARTELEQGYKTGKKATFRQRCHMILLSDKGKQVREIAELFDYNYPVITRWFTRYEEGGIEALHTAKGGGRPSIIRIDNEVETKRIKEIIAKHPQQLKEALPVIEEEFNHTMSLMTLKRFLKKTVTGTNGSET